MTSLHSLFYGVLAGPLIAFLAISWILLLVWPRARYPELVAVLVPIWVLIAWLVGRPEASTASWSGLGDVIFLLCMAVTIVAALLRFFISIIREDRRQERMPSLDWRIAHKSIVGTLLSAMMLELGPILGHKIGATATFALLLIASFASWGWVRHFRQKDELGSFSKTIATVLTLGFLLSIMWPPIVLLSAERLTKGSDYCLLVADGGLHNRPAANLWELSPFVMRATETGSLARNRHGYLVLAGQRSAHWSYMYGGFMPESIETMADDNQSPDTRCTPVPNYPAQLPLF